MMNLTQDKVSASDLVVLVSREGVVEWSTHRSRAQVVAMLRSVANGIELGAL